MSNNTTDIPGVNLRPVSDPAVRQLVDANGEVFEYRSKKGTPTHESWSVGFSRAVNALTDAHPSRTAYRVFLMLFADGMSGNELLIDKELIAKRCGVTSGLIRSAIRELAALNILLVLRKDRGLPVYLFNPRIVWRDKMKKRPKDLSIYPLVGRSKPTEKTT